MERHCGQVRPLLIRSRQKSETKCSTIDRQRDVGPTIATSIRPHLRARIDFRQSERVRVEIVSAGLERLVPYADTANGNDRSIQFALVARLVCRHYVALVGLVGLDVPKSISAWTFDLTTPTKPAFFLRADLRHIPQVPIEPVLAGGSARSVADRVGHHSTGTSQR